MGRPRSVARASRGEAVHIQISVASQSATRSSIGMGAHRKTLRPFIEALLYLVVLLPTD